MSKAMVILGYAFTAVTAFGAGWWLQPAPLEPTVTPPVVIVEKVEVPGPSLPPVTLTRIVEVEREARPVAADCLVMRWLPETPR